MAAALPWRTRGDEIPLDTVCLEDFSLSALFKYLAGVINISLGTNKVSRIITDDLGTMSSTSGETTVGINKCLGRQLDDQFQMDSTGGHAYEYSHVASAPGIASALGPFDHELPTIIDAGVGKRSAFVDSFFHEWCHLLLPRTATVANTCDALVDYVANSVSAAHDPVVFP